ncbi:MAG: retropepsin-like domain-containing protein [Bacteroidaceae bacterium]|nr:retropepsin-like domain-containing protein [Bacteroidaceae bacterium]
MKKPVLLLTVTVLIMSAKAQSVDERIGAAMNASDNFGLYDIYYSTPKDSINPFLEVFSRCMIGNRFNRPDLSIEAFDELFKTRSEHLDLNLFLSSSVMYAMDLSRVGRNDEAYSLLSSVLSSAYRAVDSATLVPYANMAAQYKALTKYSPYRISIDGEKGIVPFDTVRAGKMESEQYLMQITDAQINGTPVRITFDTGAGVNVITDSLAKAYGLEFLDADVAATGVESSAGRYALARELTLGNVTVKDVPFYVIDVRSHNEKADRYIDVLNLIVGSELMLQLKDVTLDFRAKEMQIPRNAAAPSHVRPNMCFSTGMNLLAAAEINRQPLLIKLDSGDAGYGRLNKDFFEANREYLTLHCQSDTVNQAGVGGVWSVLCYTLPDATLTLGGNSVKVPSVAVQTEQHHGHYMEENNLGIKSMMLFRKVRFNLVDMVFSTEL